MILEWYLLFKMIIRIDKKMIEVCGKPSNFLTKSYLFIFYIFWLMEEKLIHQSQLIKYTENEIFYSTWQKT